MSAEPVRLPGFLPAVDPAARAGYADHPERVGFFTDTSVCIGCKACEVACKEWNALAEDGLSLSGMSYDNTVGLGASTWRHVAFIEQPLAGGNPRVPPHTRGAARRPPRRTAAASKACGG